jgi:hypothetical protein
MATHTNRDFSDEELAGRDPHTPEDAAALAVEGLKAERGTSEKVGEEAEEAAREVEAEEGAE